MIENTLTWPAASTAPHSRGRGAAFAAATGVSDVSCPGKNFPPHHV